MTGSIALCDIVDQGDGWVAAAGAVADRTPAVRTLLADVSPRHVVVTGCGSPYFLAETAAVLWQHELAGRAIVGAHPASEIVHRANDLLPWPADSLLVVISRSGATTELAEAIDAFRRAGGARVLAITCRSASPLAAVADLAVTFDSGFEASVAQTRSFSSMLVAVERLAAAFGGRTSPDPSALVAPCTAALDRGHRMVDALTDLESIERIDFLGSGAHYGIAREAMLKMTELALTHSAAFAFLEYRHGPKAIVDDRTVIVGLIGGSPAAGEHGVLDEMEGLGGVVCRIDADPATLASLLPPVQLLAHRRAVVRGLDPDSPRHLSAVVHLAPGLRSERLDLETPAITNPRGNRS